LKDTSDIPVNGKSKYRPLEKCTQQLAGDAKWPDRNRNSLLPIRPV